MQRGGKNAQVVSYGGGAGFTTGLLDDGYGQRGDHADDHDHDADLEECKAVGAAEKAVRKGTDTGRRHSHWNDSGRRRRGRERSSRGLIAGEAHEDDDVRRDQERHEKSRKQTQRKVRERAQVSGIGQIKARGGEQY